MLKEIGGTGASRAVWEVVWAANIATARSNLVGRWQTLSNTDLSVEQAVDKQLKTMLLQRERIEEN